MKQVKYFCDICNSEKSEIHLSPMEIKFQGNGHNRVHDQVCYFCKEEISEAVEEKVKGLKGESNE